MNLAALGAITPTNSPSTPAAANQQSEAAVRRMASEFEALLLRQLTSSINSNTDDEEPDALFGNGGGGLGLSRQLFGEQMADTMAKSGGVGLADMIVKQVMGDRDGKANTATPATARALDAARSVRMKSPAKVENNNVTPRSESVKSVGRTRNRVELSLAPIPEGGADDIIIISRASDEKTTTSNYSASNVARTNTSIAPVEVSSADDSDSPATNPAVDTDTAIGSVNEVSPSDLVRPRRVHPLADVNESVPVAAPSLRTVLKPLTRSAVSGTVRVNAFTRAVNAPSARVKAVTTANLVADTNTVANSLPVILQMYVNGPIRSRFGPRIDPINGRLRYHTGIDIAAPAGTPIGAAAAGRVVFAGRNGGYGNMVIVEHADGTLTRYGHAEKLLVKKGDEVSSGQAIALVGSTGHSTGPHLHFEVKRNGQFVNPLTVLPKDFTLARR
jgi:murein DD-endopeptidase MepM/ murein hydrolase activator NlpD